MPLPPAIRAYPAERNPKSEIRNPKQIRSPKSEGLKQTDSLRPHLWISRTARLRFFGVRVLNLGLCPP
jgi:hypothetical protein